jgi:hypothetical protein
MRIYGQHYSKNKSRPANLSLMVRHGTGFCIGNVLKYAQRYGRRDNQEDWRSDLLKVIHYSRNFNFTYTIKRT